MVADELYKLLTPPGQSAPPLFWLADSEEVALWRSALRRYLWLNLMHNTISDSKVRERARIEGHIGRFVEDSGRRPLTHGWSHVSQMMHGFGRIDGYSRNSGCGNECGRRTFR